MNRIYRIFAFGVGVAVCLSAAEVRRVGEERRVVDRPTSVSKVVDPKGQIKSNVDVKKQFDTAKDVKGVKDVKDVTDVKKTGTGGKDFSKKGTLTGVFNGTEKKTTPDKPTPKPKPPAGPKL